MKRIPKTFAAIATAAIMAAFAACSSDSSSDNTMMMMLVQQQQQKAAAAAQNQNQLNNSSSSGENNPSSSSEKGLENAAPGSVVTIDGQEMIILENTWYTEPSTDVRAANEIKFQKDVPEDLQKLATKFNGLDIEEMLKTIGINGHIKTMTKRKEEMPYQQGGSVYVTDNVYFYNQKGQRIARFQINWNSDTFLQAVMSGKYNNNNANSLEAVNNFTSLMGLKPIESTASKYTYKEEDFTDESKYSEFRVKYDPTHCKFENYPENYGEPVSTKKYLSYTYTLNSEGKNEKYGKEYASSYTISWDYQNIYINGKDSIRPSHKTGDAPNLDIQFNLLDKSYDFYLYWEGRTSGNKIITAQGTGEVGVDVDKNITNKISLLKNNSDIFVLQKEKSGIDRIKLALASSENGKKFSEQTVKLYKNGTRDTSKTWTLKEAIKTYMDGEVMYEDFDVTGTKKLPETLKLRALFPKTDGKNHNKDYTIVTFKLNSENSYELEKNSTIAATGEVVPEFVKKYSDNLAKVYSAAGYTDEPEKTVSVEKGKLYDITASTDSDYKTTENATLGEITGIKRDFTGTLILFEKISLVCAKNTALRISYKDGKICRLNFNGDSIYEAKSSKQMSKTDTVNLGAAQAYVKVPFTGTGTLKFTGASTTPDYCGKFVVTDKDGKILLLESAKSVANHESSAEAQEYSAAITGDAYILFSREAMKKADGNATGGANIYSIKVE